MTLSKNQESSPLICKVEYAFTDDIDSIAKIGVHQVQITMKSGKAFQSLYGTPASFSFVEQSGVTRSGLLFKQKLSVYYPGLNELAQPEIYQLILKPVVVKIYYQHGVIRVMGSLVEPGKAAAEFNSSDATGYSIVFACDSIESARMLVIV